MHQQQEIELIKAVSKLEERSKHERLSRHELHSKIDLLLLNVDSLKDYHDKDIDPLKKSLKCFIWLGEHKKILTTVGVLILVSFIEKLPTIYEFILKKFGL